MDIIELARQLGAAIQKEDAYVAYRAAKEANDARREASGSYRRIQSSAYVSCHRAAKARGSEEPQQN